MSSIYTKPLTRISYIPTFVLGTSLEYLTPSRQHSCQRGIAWLWRSAWSTTRHPGAHPAEKCISSFFGNQARRRHAATNQYLRTLRAYGPTLTTPIERNRSSKIEILRPI